MRCGLPSIGPVDPARPHLVCVGGEDHHLRIPFILALMDRGFRVTAVASGDPAPFERVGVPFRSFHLQRFIGPVADQTSIGQLRAILLEHQVDLVQSFDTKPNLLVPLASRGLTQTRVVRTINGLGWVYSSRSPVALGLRPAQRALHRLVKRWVTATIFQNQDDMAFFQRHRMLGDQMTRLIPGSGIDLNGFSAATATAPAPDALRAAFGLGTAPVVLTVTRLTRRKGIPTLLQAAKIVHATRPDVRFVLVGPRESEGPLAVRQEEIDRHAPYVIALGRRDDVPALLKMADIFAFPTEYREGVPRVLLEAGLAALPMVATAMPGCNDVIRDGWNGFLVPPRRPDLLAIRILDMLDDPVTARVMGRYAHMRVTSEFGLELTATRYHRLYQEVLSIPGANAPATVLARPRLHAAGHDA